MENDVKRAISEAASSVARLHGIRTAIPEILELLTIAERGIAMYDSQRDASSLEAVHDEWLFLGFLGKVVNLSATDWLVARDDQRSEELAAHSETLSRRSAIDDWFMQRTENWWRLGYDAARGGTDLPVDSTD